MVILWGLSSMSEVKEYFVLICSTRFSFISLILDAFLQWNSLVFSHGLLNLSSEMYHLLILYHGAIPNRAYLSRSVSNVMYFMTPFTIHFSLSFRLLQCSDFTCPIKHSILLFIHSNSLGTFYLLGTVLYTIKGTKMNDSGSLHQRCCN